MNWRWVKAFPKYALVFFVVGGSSTAFGAWYVVRYRPRMAAHHSPRTLGVDTDYADITPGGRASGGPPPIAEQESFDQPVPPVAGAIFIHGGDGRGEHRRFGEERADEHRFDGPDERRMEKPEPGKEAADGEHHSDNSAATHSDKSEPAKEEPVASSQRSVKPPAPKRKVYVGRQVSGPGPNGFAPRPVFGQRPIYNQVRPVFGGAGGSRR